MNMDEFSVKKNLHSNEKHAASQKGSIKYRRWINPLQSTVTNKNSTEAIVKRLANSGSSVAIFNLVT